MKSLIWLLLFTALLTGSAYGQGRNAKVSRGVVLPEQFGSTADDIQDLRPEIAEDILIRDADVIQHSLPVIRRLYSQRKFHYNDADNALLSGWKQLRVKLLAPDAALTTEMLVNYVSGFGKLIIKSKPAGAVVELDGNKLSDKTNAVAWASAATYRIKLSLDGYHPVEAMFTVAEGKPTFFERTLKPLKRKRVKPSKQIKPQ